MTTPDEIAVEYARRIRASRDPRREAQRLIDELNGLPHLTRADRLLVFDLVCEHLSPGPAHTYIPRPWSGDNSRTLQLIKAIRGMIK